MRTGDSEELVATTIDLISRKWHPVIVQRLLETGPLGFSELQATVEGISAKVLTDSLADLGEHDLIERTVVSETPLRVEYELTERGRDLQSVIVALEEWGERHLEAEPDPLVLVVDDDPRTVSMYDGWLDDRFLIERAYSGEEAIRKVTDDVPFDAYVEKPSERAALVSVVEEALARGDSARETRELLALQAKRTLLQGVRPTGRQNRPTARLDR